MSRKEILIIFLMMCCLFSLQAVAATSDGNSTDSAVLTVDSDVSAYSLPNLDNQLRAGSGNAGTFSDLQSDIYNGKLERNYTYNSSDTGLSNGITISSDLTIDGEGKVTIDAKNQARVFNIASGATVTLKGITFINGNALGNGGSISSSGVLTLIDCKFINNTANGHGGAVYMDHSTRSTIENCEFNGNVAGLNGGAIDWRAGSENGKVIKSTFTNNTAKRSGGAIHWSGHYGTISASNFTDNKATGDVIGEINGVTGGGDGGAVLWVGSHGIIKDNCNFIDNFAKYRGGAIFVHGNSTENCTNTTVTMSKFENNIAGLNGGAIDWQSGTTNGILSYSTFTNNTAYRSGGAVYWYGTNGTVSNCDFTDNHALGTVDAHDQGIVTYPTFGGNGGAILWTGSIGKVENTNFTNNDALHNGGAVYLQSSVDNNCTNTSFTDCIFESNIAGLNGGAIDWHEGATEGNVYNSKFINNIANSNGGAIFWSGHNGEIHYSNFTNNTAKGLVADGYGNIGDGGAIIWSGTNGTVTDCWFVNNSADRRGGAVYLQNSTHENCTNTAFEYVYFINNTAGTNGGAIDWHEGAHNGHVYYAVFEQNTAKRSGGAIYWNGNSGEIKHSNFTNNKALGINNASDAFGNITYGGDGGAVIWIGSEGSVDNCAFIDNEAAKRGGAVYLQGSSDGYCNNTNFTNSRFENNVAGTNGGAIDWNKGAHNGLVENVTFINNTAKRSGGAIFWNGHNGTIKYTRFYDNHALGIANATNVYGEITYGGDGGALMWSGAMGNVFYSNFANNTAAKHGGAVYLQGSEDENSENTHFNHTYFINNTAGVDGGAISFEVGVTEGFVENSKFINNTAVRNGGAINFLAGSSGGHIYNSTFDNNTAKRSGGAFYWEGNNGTVMYCNFTNNRATGTTLEYDMVLTYENIVVVNKTLPAASDSAIGKLYIVDNSTDKNHIHYISYVLEKNNGTYTWIKLDEAKFVNDTSPSPTDWGMDQFFGGNGGTILWGGDVGLIDHCIITGSNSARRGGGAYMRGSNNITFSNCEFANDTSGTNGGALDWLAGANYGKVINCTFEDNRAARSAGTIYYDGDYGEFTNITIKNSYANGGALKVSRDGLVHYAGWDSSHWDTNTTGGDAGAIMITGNHVYIYNATFTNCTAVGRGGAVFLQDNDNVTFDLCLFEDNTALGTANNTYNDARDTGSGLNKWYTGNGGAIGFDKGASNGTIINSKFINNTAARNGGAISFSVNSTDAHISNSSFINNTAYRSGGALEWDGTNGNVNYCNFTGNSALGNAISTEYANLTSLNDVVAVNSLPKPSIATDNKLYVRVIYDGDKKAKYELWVSQVGDIHYWLQIDETTETGPSPIDWAMDVYYGGDGGSIYWSGDNATIENCKFIDSNSARRGGGAYMTGGDYVGYINCTFENCTSGTNGGGLDWLAGANYGKVIDCNFTNTQAARSAGAIYYDGDYGEFRNIIIKNTTAHGGDLNESKDGKVKYARWDSSHWDTNTTGGDGGAIMFTGDNIKVYNVNITDCTATGRGGAVFIQDNDNVTFESCYFENNRALGTANNTFNDPYDPSSGINKELTGHGGAISFDIGATGSSVINSIFINNTAELHGGAVHFREGASEDKIINSSFTKNHANEDGGALFVTGFDCELHNSTFYDNYAGDDGGAVYWNGDNGIIHNITCVNNSGISSHGNSKGGTLCLVGDNMALSDSTFNQSYAMVTGGAIFATGNYVNITGCDFYDSNVTNSTGGAIQILGDHNLVIDCTVEECHANYGSAIYAEGHYTKIINSTFTRNNATEDGGAVYVSGDHSELHNSTFTHNIAGDDGGAIYWEGDYGTICNITCENNKGISLNDSNSNGGTICITGNNITLSDSTFKNSSAVAYGGAIYVTGNGVDIETSEFETCNSSTQGGAIYILGDKTTISDCTFKDCNGTQGGAIYVEGNDATISANITDTHAMGADSYGITVDYKFYKDVLKVVGRNVDSMIDYVANMQSITLTDVQIANVGSILQNLSVAIENILTGNGINMANLTKAIDILTQLNQTLAQLNVTLPEGQNKNDIIYLLDGVKYIDEEFDYIIDIHNSTDVPADIIGDIDAMSHDVNDLSSAVDKDDLQSLLNKIKGDVEQILGGNTFNSTYVEDALRLLNEFNETLSGLSVSGNDKTIVNKLLGEVKRTTDKLNNLADLVVVPEVVASGGAIYISGNGALIDNSSIKSTDADYGGAIYISGNGALIDNSLISSSDAIYGGGIYIAGHDVTVDHSEFINLNSTEDGGAIFITGQRGNLYNSKFINNTAGDDGGAIYWDGNYGTISNITCENNNGISFNGSSSNGGTIALTGNDTSISKSSFKDTYALISGGAIFVSGSRVNITDSEFENCNVSMDIVETGKNYANGGGAIYLLGDNSNVVNCTFDNSKAREGGVIYVQGNHVTIDDAKTTNSHATDGGSFYVSGDFTTISNTAVYESNATVSGGAIFINGNHTDVIESSFENTRAFGHNGDGGGAIFVKGNDADIIKSNFTNTEAKWDAEARGGAMFITGANAMIIDSKFDNANSNIEGGAIYVNGTNTTIRGSEFEKCAVNSNGSEGGSIYVNGENTIIEGSNFINSTAIFRGGAIYIDGANAKVKDSNFTGSSVTGGEYTGGEYEKAKPGGGAIYIKAHDASVEGSIFNRSSVSNSVGQGGAIYIEGNRAKILGSEFESSSAKTGGAIYLEGNSSNVIESAFTYSYANENGGAIYSTGSSSTVYNSNFTYNLAEFSGGAVYWYGGTSSKYNTVDGCIFTNNTAHGNAAKAGDTRGGGAIYWSEHGESGTIKNSNFYYNSVQSTIDKKVDGGAVLWDKSYHALVDNCIFVGNFVTTNGDTSGTGADAVWAQGGAMYLRPYDNYTVRNCRFENCSSSKEAGALYIQSNDVPKDYTGVITGRKILLEDSVFINNVAQARGNYNNNGGGAIQIKQCKKTDFKNLTFINNTANKGGALCVYDSTTNLIVDGANFTSNKAVRGSAISASVAFTLKNAVLLKNRADTASFDLTFDRDNQGSIDISLKGNDNSLNAMYIKGSKSFYVTCENVTYWTNDNKSSGTTAVTFNNQNSGDIPVSEAGISITVELFDANNNKLNVGNDIFATDANGDLQLTPDDFPKISSFDGVYVVARLTNEDYYTQVIKTTRLPVKMQATADNATYHRNATVHVTITPTTGSPNANGTVSVYYGDVFLGNITIANNVGMSDEILTNITADKFLEVGVHNLTLKYWGDLYNDAVNLTVPINVTKAQSNMTFYFDEMGYDLITHVIIVDDWNDMYYADANGEVTLTLYKENSPVPLQSKTVYIFNGTGVTFFDLLPANYTIKAIYHGDDNYNASVNSTPAQLNKKEDVRIIIDINATDIMVDEEVFINITVLTNGINATGNVTLYLDNEKYILPLNDSKAQFHLGNLSAGDKIVIVCYEGSRNLQANSGDANFTVSKYNTTFEIGVTNITHNQKEIINITFLNETEGVVYISVDDRNYSAVINNRTAILELVNLTVGEHNVTVRFPGDWKYNNVINMTRFYVEQITPDVIIDVGNVTYGNPSTVVIRVPDCVSGDISIKINGQPYGTPKQIENGKVIFDLGILNAGNYTVEAVYSGDANHTAAISEQKFSVFKDNRTIDIEVENIIYGAVEHIKVHVNATGTVTIKVNGKSQTITLNNGTAELNLTNLVANTYAVDVTYNGNDNYSKSSASKEFVVSKMTTSLDVQVHDIFVRDMEYINITVRNSTGDIATNLNGTLTIDVDGVSRTAPIVNGMATFHTAEFNGVIGKRTVWVFYDGDENFTASREKKTYQVNTRTLFDDEWNVTAKDIYVGEAGYITVHLPKDVTGFVEIEVRAYDNYRDDTYYSKVTAGEAVAYPKDLREGKYHVYVTYIGTDYTESYLDTHFEVFKRNVNVTIDVNDTAFDNTSNIVVYVDDGVEGSITIRINDTVIGTYGIVDGKVNTTVKLGPGTYTVYAEYGGDYMYLENKTESKGFTVDKAVPVITIDTPEVVDAATNATIIVRINQTATGNITITVNGTKYNATIENGIATFTIDQLLAGKYDITAEYDGDGNYAAAATATLIDGLIVNKVECYQINVTANDTKVDLNTTIIVKVPADATGNVSIYVDRVFVGNATISQGIAQLNITRPYGNHTINATFTDGKYGPRYAVWDYWVFKLESPVSIDVNSIMVGDKAYINVTAPNDNVTIEINGKSYTRVKYENGIAYFEVSGLEHGNKTVVAIYGGSDKYVQNATTANFTVSKRNSYVKVNVSDINVGDVAYINVTVPSNATGHVIVNVNGANYTVNLTGGIGSLSVEGLGNGTYNVIATYLGDNQYLSSINDTQTFGVNKVASSINITISNFGVIGNGSDADIIVKVPVDATGKVEITLAKEFESKTYTIYVNDGIGTLHLETPEIGIYNVTAKYLGDGKYIGSENKSELDVYINGKELFVDTIPTTIEENEIITVWAQGNHTDDNVTVIITDNAGNVILQQNVTFNDYVALLNGSSAKLQLDPLPAGDYIAYGRYLEIDGLKEIIHLGNNPFTVSKLNSTLAIKEIKNITVGENATIELILNPSAATGNISVFINGIEYNLTTSDLTLTIPNLGAGDYYVRAFYHGNQNYSESNVLAVFKVSKVNPQITVNATNITVGEDVLIEITAPEDIALPVLVDVGGRGYYVNITAGKGQLYVPYLDSGNYTVVVRYTGDDKYNETQNATKFEVSKVPSTVNVTVENITVGDKAVIKVETPKDLYGNVTVSVDGKNYTVFVSGGEGTLVVSDLGVGPYTVDVTFNGSKKYKPSNNTATFNVNKVKTSESDIKVIDQGNGTVLVVVPNNATGNVTIKVGDKQFNATVVNGTATVELVDVAPGDYEVDVTYSGDDNYNATSTKANITAPKYDSSINITVGEIIAGENGTVVVTVGENATGVVTVSVDGKNFTAEVINGTAVVEIGNLTAGPKTVVVEYSGDGNYTSGYAVGNFTVEPAMLIMVMVLLWLLLVIMLLVM